MSTSFEIFTRSSAFKTSACKRRQVQVTGKMTLFLINCGCSTSIKDMHALRDRPTIVSEGSYAHFMLDRAV